MSKPNINTLVAKRLKKIREEKGVTTATLSEKVGINHLTLEKYEKEESSPRFDTLVDLSIELGVPLADLVNPKPTVFEVDKTIKVKIEV